MTYEEKLQKIVLKLKEERQLTRKNHITKISFDDKTFTKVRLKDIVRILLILESDEGALKIVDSFAINPPPEKIGKPLQEEDCEEVVQILVELNESFDNWYTKYLLKQKSSLLNLNWINLIKILDVCADIDQQLQIERGSVVLISSFPYPYLGRFPDLFPFDSVGTRKVYQQHRWEGAQYLKKEGIALRLKPIMDDSLGYGSIEVTLDIDLFNDFYQKIRDEYAKRNDSNKVSAAALTNPVIVQDNQAWPTNFIWDGNTYIFGEYGTIDFDSEDRKHIFKVLTDKKGGWATINDMKGSKDAGYVRSTIKQIEDRLPVEVKKKIKILSTKDDDIEEKPKVGAYKIRILP